MRTPPQDSQPENPSPDDSPVGGQPARRPNEWRPPQPRPVGTYHSNPELRHNKPAESSGGAIAFGVFAALVAVGSLLVCWVPIMGLAAIGLTAALGCAATSMDSRAKGVAYGFGRFAVVMAICQLVINLALTAVCFGALA